MKKNASKKGKKLAAGGAVKTPGKNPTADGAGRTAKRKPLPSSPILRNGLDFVEPAFIGAYERLALSRNKAAVRKLAIDGQVIARPEDVLKEPYILEFLGLEERAAYTESDLEEAIIESRQHRFTFDEDHFFVDLVFYNRLLRSYVLIDRHANDTPR